MDFCVAMSHDIQEILKVNTSTVGGQAHYFSTFSYHKLLFFFLVVPIPAWHGWLFSACVQVRKRKQYIFLGFGKRNIRGNFGSLPSCLYGPHVSWHPATYTAGTCWLFISYFPSCSEISSSERETQLHYACRSLKINHPNIVYQENARVNSLLHCL